MKEPERHEIGAIMIGKKMYFYDKGVVPAPRKAWLGLHWHDYLLGGVAAVAWIAAITLWFWPRV